MDNKPSKQKALLLFAHQGRSYLPAVLRALAPHNVSCLVLSSRPRDPVDIANLRAGGADAVWSVDEEYLDDTHVTEAIERAQSHGYEIVAALATFEGYRVLMCTTNNHLQATDVNPAAIVHTMDKYLCRRTLAEYGLSRANAHIVEASNIKELQESGRKLFIKPRRGAGSFACFRLDREFSAHKLAVLQKQMRDDLAFRAIFAGQFDFIAEDYIQGDEYSFEVLVSAGESYVIGVHAKYLDDSSGITLETSNSCPAPRLSDVQQLAGEDYINRCLTALSLDEGCYHIEARHNPVDGHWDIIEINARMGGALINQSIGVFTGGVTVLDLWVHALCCTSIAEKTILREKLAALRESSRRALNTISHGTVFFSRYGLRDRVLEKLSAENLPRKPDICEIPVREGTRLPDSERGIFILNALWCVDVKDITSELANLSSMLDEHLVVEYAPEVSKANLL